MRNLCHILACHDVLTHSKHRSGFDTPGAAAYKIDLKAFHAHLKALARRVSDPPLLLNSTNVSGWALTFDDGGISNYDTILPVLEDRGWKAHFFIVTGQIGNEGFMSAGQIREMHQLGHSIGSHSVTHPRQMRKLPIQTLQDEWQNSKRYLEDLLGLPIKSAAIPFGSYDHNLLKVLTQAGYRSIFTSDPVSRPKTIHDATVYGRYSVTANTSSEKAARRAAGLSGSFSRERTYFYLKKVARFFMR